MRWIFLAPFVVLSSFCLSTIIGQAQLGVTYGDAVNLGGGCYQLTDSSMAQRGAVWYFGTVDVSQSWEMTANLLLGNNNSGADGLVFVLRDPNSSNLGASGSSLGYAGNSGYEAIYPSLGVEVDTYTGALQEDPYFDHIAILSNGQVTHGDSAAVSMPVSAMIDSSNIEIGEEFDLRVTYCASSQLMTVFWDDQERISEVVDLAFIGTNHVKWGFTASTGGFSNQHRVCGAQWIELEDGAGCECLDLNMNEICDDLEGCADLTACNYDPAAEADNGTCDYSCCPGPGCCSDGMYWDYDLQVCQVIETCEEDLDGDGVVGVNDLMQLLSSFGTDCPLVEPAEWTCGNPVSYHGYDYETVLIGEQCWFAENSRFIPSVSPASDYSMSEPRCHVYGYNGSAVEEAVLTAEYGVYGALYNFQAVQQWAICPTGWHVPSDEDWMGLELTLGIPADSLDVVGYRGCNIGDQLKSESLWNGTDQSGMNMLPGGGTVDSGEFVFLEERGWFWSSTEAPQQAAWFRQLESNQNGIYRAHWNQNQEGGKSVRCIKD